MRYDVRQWLAIFSALVLLIAGIRAACGSESPWGSPESELRKQADAEAEALRLFANEFAKTHKDAKADVRKVVLCDSERDVALQLHCGGYFPFAPREKLPASIRRGMVAGADVSGRIVFTSTPDEYVFFHECGHVVLQTNSENKANAFANRCLQALKNHRKTKE